MMRVVMITLATWLIAATAMAQAPKDAALPESSKPPPTLASEDAKLAALAPLAQGNLRKDDEQQRVLLLLLMGSGGWTRPLGSIDAEGHPAR
jgi:hypothetical protein